MSYPKRQFQFRPTKGYVADTPASELPPDYWGGSIENVIFRNGFAQRIGGARAAYGTWPAALFHILNARVDTTNYWLGFGASTITARETSNSNSITGAALTTADEPWQYSSTLLNGVPVFTNTLDPPRYWAGDVGTGFVVLPGFPSGTTCGSIAAFRYHLFALDITEPGGHFEGKLLWSDAAAPGTVPATWTASASNEAGDTELSDTPGPLQLAVPCRGSLYLYKRSSLYAADWVGGNDIFSFRTLFTSSGALTRHAVADINGQHLVVTDGDIILTDGTNRRSIGQARMREYLFRQLDATNYQNLFTIYNRAKGEVLIAYPESGNTYCTKALVYDVANDSFGVRDLAAVTCAAVGVVNDTSLSEIIDDQADVIDTDTRYMNQANFSLATESLMLSFGTETEQQDTQDAVTRAAVIGRYDLTMDEPERLKFVRRVHVRTTPNSGTLYVRVGSRMTPTGDFTWGDEQTLTDGEQSVNVRAQGRYISVEIRSAGSEEWRVLGVDVEYELRGYR
jgi:hypothetical protein